MDIIDERFSLRRPSDGAGVVSALGVLLPSSPLARLVLLLAVALAAKLVYDYSAARLRASKLQRRRRRAAGIPDSDTRRWGVAAAEARARREREKLKKPRASSSSSNGPADMAARRPVLNGYAPAMSSPLRTSSYTHPPPSPSMPSSSSPDRPRVRPRPRLQPLFPSLPSQRSSLSLPSVPNGAGINSKSNNYGLEASLLPSSTDIQEHTRLTESAPPSLEQIQQASSTASRKRPARSESSYAPSHASGSAPPATKRTKAEEDERTKDAASRKRPAHSEAGESSLGEDGEGRRKGKKKRLGEGDTQDQEDVRGEGSDDSETLRNDKMIDDGNDDYDAGDQSMKTAGPAQGKHALQVFEDDNTKYEMEDDEDVSRETARAKLRAQAVTRSKRNGNAKATSSKRNSAAPQNELSTSLEDVERQPGDVWQNAHGDLFKLDQDGITRKKVGVYERQSKYKMVRLLASRFLCFELKDSILCLIAQRLDSSRPINHASCARRCLAVAVRVGSHER